MVAEQGIRATYVRFSEHERQEDWLAGIEAALYYFGRVPLDLLYVTPSASWLMRDDFGEDKHHWNSHLLQMARDYGFTLRAFGLIAPRPKA